MAKKEQDISSDLPEVLSEVGVETEVQYTPLKTFADHNALKYGVELMGGFYHEQEVGKHYADTEENWHILMDEFMKKEVK